MSFQLARHITECFKGTFVVKCKRYRSFRPNYDGVKADDKVKYVSNILHQHLTLNGIVKSELRALCDSLLRVFAPIFMGRWDGRLTGRPSLYLLGHLLIAKVNASAHSAWI